MNDPYGQRPYQVSAHFDADIPDYPESHCRCEFCDDQWCSDDQEDIIQRAIIRLPSASIAKLASCTTSKVSAMNPLMLVVYQLYRRQQMSDTTKQIIQSILLLPVCYGVVILIMSL